VAVELPATDQRAENLRNLNQRFELPTFVGRREWERRARWLRTHILAVNGLLPMPEPPPLRAKVFDTIEYADYSVSKVYFQSHPGLLVTGSLFVPRGKKGPFPAVLNPHGHWPKGRLHNDQRGTVLGRGITFARQGYVAFCYDMIGFCDSTQLVHRQESDRQRLWGFSQMALQLYNSIRSVDFLQSLPDVDPERIGCTGASGGGTQTFMLMAVDQRIKVAAPVNMVSAIMQGGCVCENAPTLRLETTNPEIAALMAPRPLLLVAATGDWTVNNPTLEYPFIRSIYKLYEAQDRVQCVQFDAEHNYNLDSRNAVYRFFAKWLLGADEPEMFDERPYRLAARTRYLVFADRERPKWAPDGEKLIEKLVRRRRSQIRAMWPADARELDRFREQIGAVIEHLLMAKVPRAREVRVIRGSRRTIEGIIVEDVVLTRPAVGEQVPASILRPPAARRKAVATLVVSARGKKLLLNDAGRRHELVNRLLSAGQTVLLVDCWGVGEASLPPDHVEKVLQIDHYLTYNRSDDMNRIQDILTALGALRARRSVRDVNLVGLDDAGLWSIIARTQAPFVNRTVVDMGGGDLDKDETFLRHLYVPAIRSIGDIAAASALVAPGRLCLHNLGRGLDTSLIRQAYIAAGRPRHLRLESRELGPAVIGRYLDGIGG